jgi:hypothetical protein
MELKHIKKTKLIVIDTNDDHPNIHSNLLNATPLTKTTDIHLGSNLSLFS